MTSVATIQTQPRLLLSCGFRWVSVSSWPLTIIIGGHHDAQNSGKHGCLDTGAWPSAPSHGADPTPATGSGRRATEGTCARTNFGASGEHDSGQGPYRP